MSLVLKKLNQTSVDDFYEVVSKRYEASSTIVTTNKPFDEWGHIFYDPLLASAILDRFVHHCNFVVIDGPSYRMRDRTESFGNAGGISKDHGGNESPSDTAEAGEVVG
jgi:DNA replication protein DnaC